MTGTFLRDGHGKGRGVPRVEGKVHDELPPASPALTDRPERDAAGRWSAGNAASRSRKVRPTVGGVVLGAMKQADPLYQTFCRWGQRYGAHRRAELAKAHGGEISAGVGALVESEANALCDARYVRAKASESGDPTLFKLAASLSTEARQCALASWSLAALEAQARPRENAIDVLARRLAEAPKGDA